MDTIQTNVDILISSFLQTSLFLSFIFNENCRGAVQFDLIWTYVQNFVVFLIWNGLLRESWLDQIDQLHQLNHPFISQINLVILGQGV